MKRRTFLGLAVCLGLLLSVAVGLTRAQELAPRIETVGSADPVSRSFTYQGRLLLGGNPVNGNCDFQFGLWDEETGGTQIGSTQTKTNVNVSSGLFSVALDFGASTPSYFSGEARWLAISVRYPAGSGSYQALTPRQPLRAVPYALSLRPGAIISSTGDALYAYSVAGEAVNAATDTGKALYGHALATTGSNYGVYGTTESSSGLGGYFENTAATFAATGLYAKTRAPEGYAGYFENAATTQQAIGVAGTSASPAGYGGRFTNSTTASDSTGSGVLGQGPIYGVRGKAVGVATYPGDFPPPIYGVYGETGPLPGLGYGVYGKSNTGVYGFGTTNDGVVGYADGTGSSITRGVVGHTRSTNARSAGVYGVADTSAGGHGVYAETSGSGSAASALWAQNNNANGIAIWGKAQGNDSTLVLEHKAGSGDLIRGFQTDPGDLRFKVDANGGVWADGAYRSPASDFAEMLPATGGLEPGEVLAIGPDSKLTRSTQPYATNVVGVYSTKPGFVGGATDGGGSGTAPLAIAGVVPVKASAENGSIQPGDLLVASSTPGHAMKADSNPPAGTVIGKALQGLDRGTGSILLLVMLR